MLHFLHSKIALFAPTDLLLNIQHDNLYVKPKIQYKVNNIVGHTANNKQETASRIQCVMLASIMLKNNDIMSLTHVQNMTPSDLHAMFNHVIPSNEVIHHQNWIHENCVISDNNRNSFMLLSGSD